MVMLTLAGVYFLTERVVTSEFIDRELVDLADETSLLAHRVQVEALKNKDGDPQGWKQVENVTRSLSSYRQLVFFRDANSEPDTEYWKLSTSGLGQSPLDEAFAELDKAPASDTILRSGLQWPSGGPEEIPGYAFTIYRCELPEQVTTDREWLRDRLRQTVSQPGVGISGPSLRSPQIHVRIQHDIVRPDVAQQILDEVRTVIATAAPLLAPEQLTFDKVVDCTSFYACLYRIPISETYGRDVNLAMLVSHEELALRVQDSLTGKMWQVSLFMFAVAVIAALILSILIIRPLRTVIDTSERIAEGVQPYDEIDSCLPLSNQTEVGDVARAVRNMVQEIKRKGVRLQSIVDTAADGIVICGADEKIVMFNPAAQQILGYRDDDIRDAPFFELLQNGQDTTLRGLMDEDEGDSTATGPGASVFHRIAESSVVTLECTGLRGGVDEFLAELSVAEFREGDEQLFTIIIRDISERRDRDRLRKQKEELEEANRYKQHGLQTIAHELLTPLTGIRGAADLLQRNLPSDLPEVHSRRIQRVIRGCDNCKSIIQDLRRIARYERGKYDLNVEHLSPEALIRVCVGDLSGEFSRKDVTVDLYLDGPPESIRADKAKFQQILTNLLTNAYKYNERGGRIIVRATTDQPEQDGPQLLSVRVSDTGIGIPADQRDNIFKDFHRIKDAVERADGLGLGLGIVQRYVRLHDGNVRVDSNLEPDCTHGSTFEFAVPVMGPAVDDESNITDDSVDTSPFEKRRILVIHPEPSTFSALDKLLPPSARAKYISHADGLVDEALEFRPDAILVNMQFASTTGQDVARELRGYADFKDIPIVLTSRIPSPDLNSMFPDVGFAGHLQIPIRISPLYDCLIQLLPSPLTRTSKAT